MIKFFRKIRQRLIFEPPSSEQINKIRKYSIYAIGEIVLIVFGILIALQLNNRNTRISNQEKQENHLMLIRGEMINNLSALSRESEALLSIMDSNRKLIDLMNSDEAIEEIRESELSALLIWPISREIKVDYENGALTELISSGGLKDIQNDSISSILASWEGRFTSLLLQENAIRESLTKSSDYMEVYGNYRAIFDDIGISAYLEINESSDKGSNKSVLKSQVFENILLNYLALTETLYEREYPRYQHDLQLLIRLISQELNLENDK